MAAIAVICAGLLTGTQSDAGATRPVCVLVPHFKDEYWLSVAYGVEQAAAGQALTPVFHEAGGYRAVQRQIEQIASCDSGGAQAILIGVVSSDDPGLLRAIDSARIPVVGFVNETAATSLEGFVGVDWRDMGRVVAEFLADRHPVGTADVSAVLVTGPEEAGWTGPLETGLRHALASSAVQLVGVFHADTGVSEQLGEVETALERFGDADYLIGSAPAIESAMGLKATGVARNMPNLVSTYVSHSVLRGLSNGQVLAVAFDDPQAQGRMAVAQVARAMTRQAGSGPDTLRIRLLVQPSASVPFARLSPPGYFPESE